MTKMDGIRLFLLGLLVALAAVAVWRPGENTAQAQAVANLGNYQFFATHNGKDAPVFFIVDMSNRRFAMYTQYQSNQAKDFRLYVTRHWAPDLEFNDLCKNNQGYTVSDVEKEMKRNKP